MDAIRRSTITFSIGPAGTGKTYLAVATAVKALQQREVQRIILTRPAVEAGERLGFLPGTLYEKIDPYLKPLYDALFDMMDAEGFARLMERGTIEVAPLAYMRGRTLNDSFIILDEAQNTTPEQMKMFLTRLGSARRPSSPATSPRSTCRTARAPAWWSWRRSWRPSKGSNSSISAPATWSGTRSSRTSWRPTASSANGARRGGRRPRAR